MYNLAEANLALPICFLLFFFPYIFSLFGGEGDTGFEIENSESKLQEKEARAC